MWNLKRITIMAKKIRISRVELQRWSQPGKRVIEVHLSNGTDAHIGRCWEGWEIYDCTYDEKQVCLPVAEMFNDWLHEGMADEEY